jgi:hypothetical protein
VHGFLSHTLALARPRAWAQTRSEAF